jgi:hypothetical protein
MRQSLKEPTVILFVLIVCGSLFFSQFAVDGTGWPLNQAAPAQAGAIRRYLPVGGLKSSRILQSQITIATGAAMTLAADDESDSEDGAEEGKEETEGPDRLWDSAMLG